MMQLAIILDARRVRCRDQKVYRPTSEWRWALVVEAV
jgi:hypothetical protein